MLSRVFLGLSLVGAEWVLYALVVLSIYSVSLMIERWRFYGRARVGLDAFRAKLRSELSQGRYEQALALAESRVSEQNAAGAPGGDLESGLTVAILRASTKQPSANAHDLGELAQDSVIRAKLLWEKNLMPLATIGNNAPFIGLFGTVLGIIRAFHDLSQQSGGASAVTGGISEALVATAVGLLVAIPAVIAYNVFQRKVKTALSEAEALKGYLIGTLGVSQRLRG